MLRVERRGVSVAAGLADPAIVLLTALAGFFICFAAGRRGFFAFDQSIVFDGSYRVLSGQVPYRDFVLPFGPAAFWIHALFFRVFGISYRTYIFGAAFVNSLAVLISVRVVRLLFPRPRYLAYAAGVLTAVWFYPPFGTPWVDQTGFFFSFIAIALLLSAMLQGRRRGLLCLLSGGAAFMAFISKQNVGGFIFPLYPLLIVVWYLGDLRAAAKALGFFAGGLVGAAAGFVGYVAAGANLETFRTYFLKIPSELGGKRLHAFLSNWLGLRHPFFGGRGPLLIAIVMVTCFWISVAAVAGWVGRSREAPSSKRILLAGVMCLYCILFQHVFLSTTLNQPENGLALVGIILAVSSGLAGSIYRAAASWCARRGRAGLERRAATVGRFAVAGLALLVLFASRDGVEVAMTRKVHDIFRGVGFDGPVAIDRLRSLKWAEPTSMGGYEIRKDDLVRLYAFLKASGQNFFIFPDFTIMYGLLGRPSPQPILWFHRGVTYSAGDNSSLDEWIIRDLKKNNVMIFVLEQVSWFNTGERLNDFPKTKAYLMGDFDRTGEIGVFSIYERRPTGS